MFKSVLVLGHVRGIRLEIHVSWLIIFTLLLVTMSAGFQQQYPDWTLSVAVMTAFATAIVFFASIVAHEFGHSVVAIRRGIPVQAITLFIFGGMAQMTRDSERPEDEFWIAIAGPLVSLGLAALFGLLAVATSGLSEPLFVALGWLALINLVVAVFNMIPGFPLDGGRVFRALVWKLTGDARKGIQAAVAGGRLVAYGLFALGIWNMLFVGNLIGGVWIMLIAWFLLTTARGQGWAYDLREGLSGVLAQDLAESGIPEVAPTSSIDDWIQQQVLPAGRRAFIVGNARQPLGLISLSDVRSVPRERWRDVTVSEVMTPVERLLHVGPLVEADRVLQYMTEKNLNQVPVMQDGRILGWIDRQSLLRSIGLRLEVRR